MILREMYVKFLRCFLPYYSNICLSAVPRFWSLYIAVITEDFIIWVEL